MNSFVRIVPILTAAIVFLPAQAVYGQADNGVGKAKTWVSGTGSDFDPCSRTAPCKTFTSAMGKTLPGGEIVALDSGEFGAVAITKSITLDGSAAMAGVRVAGNGITVNAGQDDVVILRGITLDGGGVGAKGIQIVQAGKVFIADCNVFGFTTRNISVEPATNPVLVYISDTRIHDSVSNGIVVEPASPGAPAVVTLNKVDIADNTNLGLSVTAFANVIVRDSVISGNGLLTIYSNVRVDGTGGSAVIGLENVMISAGAVGILSLGGGTVVLDNSSVTYNGIGLSTAGGTVYSFGNNRLAGNVTDGSFSGTISLQ